MEDQWLEQPLEVREGEVRLSLLSILAWEAFSQYLNKYSSTKIKIFVGKLGETILG